MTSCSRPTTTSRNMVGTSTTSGTRAGGRFGRCKAATNDPTNTPAIPAVNVRGFGNFARRDDRHHKIDRRVHGQRVDEERRALGDIFKGQALPNTKWVQLHGLQFIRCSEWIGRSDPIRLWKWKGLRMGNKRKKIFWYFVIGNEMEIGMFD